MYQNITTFFLGKIQDVNFIHHSLTWIGQFVFLIALWFIYYKIKHYLPKYYETKAEYKAMQEEVGKVTKIVEGIKNEFTISVEKLKVSYSGVHKEKTAIYKAILQECYRVKDEVESFNIKSADDYNEMNKLLRKFYIEIMIINHTYRKIFLIP